MADNFEVAVFQSRHGARLHLRGELDMVAAPVLAQRLEEASPERRSLLLVDVSDLDYCDSSGIRTLLAAAARCAKDGAEMRVVGARGNVRRVFEITDTVELLHLPDDD